MSTSIHHFYPYAVAEGEGIGTAYEYFAKRRVMAPLLRGLSPGARIVVAGLPQRYGTSLDFVLAAAAHGANIMIVDERPAAIERSRGALDILSGTSSHRAPLRVEYLVRSLDDFAASTADLVLSCEVLQRVSPPERAEFVRKLRGMAPRGAIFVPNSANRAHLEISGLDGFDEAGLRAVVGKGTEIDFVDMPPFPPGISQSAAQREKAKSGLAERLAMHGLGVYCRAERFVPRALKARFAHIVYARWR